MNSEAQLITEDLVAYVRQAIAPQATKIDREFNALQQALQALAERSLLALKVPVALGGAGFPVSEYCRWQILLARYSGALAFLQTQHQSAAAMLAASENIPLQQQYLPHMGRGKILMGLGFSQLRRRGQPLTQAQEISAGYLLSGEVPWITGWGFFDRFIVGANLPDGKEIYGILPLQNQQQPRGGQIELSPPLELVGMSVTNTVSAKLHDWILSNQQVVKINPAGSIHQSSRQNVLHHSCLALGCAYAGVDILKVTAEKKQAAAMQTFWQDLTTEIQQCDRMIFEDLINPQITYSEKLRLRGWAINLAGRCSQAAVIAVGGGANYFYSAASRVYREALLFSVTGQTADVAQASLEQLSAAHLN